MTSSPVASCSAPQFVRKASKPGAWFPVALQHVRFFSPPGFFHQFAHAHICGCDCVMLKTLANSQAGIFVYLAAGHTLARGSFTASLLWHVFFSSWANSHALCVGFQALSLKIFGSALYRRRGMSRLRLPCHSPVEVVHGQLVGRTIGAHLSPSTKGASHASLTCVVTTLKASCTCPGPHTCMSPFHVARRLGNL